MGVGSWELGDLCKSSSGRQSALITFQGQREMEPTHVGCYEY